MDGLAAEREQGITIDVAYRFFSTEKRKFIVADTPGHEQYTRNMVTGASTADLAMILIDARKGVLTQTRRHSFIVSLIGIKHVVLAINKMDLVGYSQDVFDAIVEDYRDFADADRPRATSSRFPCRALHGDNVLDRSANTPWYHGPDVDGLPRDGATSTTAGTGRSGCPVQWVNRPNLDFRASPARRQRRVRRAMKFACCHRARAARSRRIVSWTAIATARSRARRSR